MDADRLMPRDVADSGWQLALRSHVSDRGLVDTHTGLSSRDPIGVSHAQNRALGGFEHNDSVFYSTKLAQASKLI
jgi:hypothetical protein